ncbi:MAG TPA: hypothetical protein DHN29_09025, partial [Cytophagales bacterium]|nr:hypothetical protein [Cytophagales bacterium]
FPNLGDFNQDGVPELYYKNEIRNAQTGALLVAGTGGTYDWYYEVAFGTLALDILPDAACADCSGLELITGSKIYSVNISSGTITEQRDMDDILNAMGESDYEFRYYRTTLSAADYNLDGNVDLVFPGAIDNASGNPQTTVFMWDVANGTVDFYQDSGNNWDRGTGRINLADIDNDGQMNAVYVSGEQLYALDENLDFQWSIGIKETSSGFTGCTLFDFNGDGAYEIIYRSEESILVISTPESDPTNPVISSESRACVSRTAEEYPVVADVDGDGASEICVTCTFSDATNIDGGNWTNTQYSHVRVFEADGEVWQPSRSVWNQHAYFNVNVNDDLTIPAVQQDHTRIFGTVDCITGDPRDVRPLNGFLNQSTIIGEDGCPSYVSPDINLLGNITSTMSICPDNTFEVTFDISNEGDTDISGNLPITFYDGDPEVAGSTQLNTQIYTLNNLQVGNSVTVTLEVEGSGGDFDLYISLNDYGGTPPITPGSSAGIVECDANNNIGSTPVTYTPFALEVNKLNDNRKCDDTKPNNGEAEAYFEGTVAGGTQTIWFEDFADLSTGTTNDNTGNTEWSSTRDASYTPNFYGVGTSFGDKSFEAEKSGGDFENGSVDWTSESIDISSYSDIQVTVDLFSNDNCDGAFSNKRKDRIRFWYNLDGAGDVLLTDGDQYGDFDYVQASVSGLNGSSLVLKAKIHTSSSNEIMAFDNVRVQGESGDITKKFTESDGYTFNWYNQNDFSSILYTGSTYSTMDAGTYSVVGYYAASNCYSDTLDVTINAITPTFDVMVYEISEVTDCTSPNGQIGAFAYTSVDTNGDPVDSLFEEDGYSFDWNFASDPGGLVIGTGDTLSNLEGGDYFVTIYDNLTGCESSNSGTVTSAPITPDLGLLNVRTYPITTCGGTGQAAADLGGNTTDYDFEWYIGSSLKATPDFTTDSISGLAEGDYLVRVRDNNTSCVSDLVALTIEDNSAAPTPLVQEVSQNTSCDTFTGEASADGDGAGTITGYTFEWWAGSGIVANNKLPGAISGSSLSNNNSVASGLPEGVYTVRVTQGGCSVVRNINITNSYTEPEFNGYYDVDTEESIVMGNSAYVELPQLMGTGNPITNAITIQYWANLTSTNYSNDEREFSSGSTGEAQVLLWSDNHDGLAFVLRTNDGTRGRINSGYSATGWAQITGTWDGSTGEMYMYVDGVRIGSTTHVGSGVIVNTGNPMYLGKDNGSTKKFAGELDEVRLYNRALSQDEIAATRCGELTGSEDGLVAYYNFNNITTTTTGTIVPDVTGNGHDGILRQDGSSFSFPTATIQCIDAGITDNTSCDASNPNGGVDVSEIIADESATYTYTLYEGFSTSSQLDQNTTGDFTNLDEGFYTITAQDQSSQCISVPITLSIGKNEDTPEISTVIENSAGCNEIGLGSISVTSASEQVEPSSYTYELYEGWSDATLLETQSVTVGSTGYLFDGLVSGNYRVRVTNDDLTCESYVDVNVGNVSVIPTISNIITKDNTYCSGGDGFIEVTMPDDNSYYSFAWYKGSVVDDDSLLSETSFRLADISSTSPSYNGQYTVVATLDSTGCETAPATRTIGENQTDPDVVVSEVQPQNGCGAGAGANGIADATVVITAGDSTTVGYTFEWSTDNINFTSPITSSTVGDKNQTDAVLAGGTTYYVRVTDNTTGCSTIKPIDIGSEPIQPVLTQNGTASPNTSCDITLADGPTGAVGVSVSFNGSGVTDLTGYTFTCHEGDNTGGQNITTSGTSNGTTPNGEDTDSIYNITNGQYTVVAQAPNGCTSNPLTVTVPYTPLLPILNEEIENNTVCDPDLAGGYNGKIIVTPTVGDANEYDYEWFEGTGVSGTAITTNTTTGSVEATAFELEGDQNYTVRVTNPDNGCSNTYTYFIDNIPAQPIIVRDDSEIRDNTTCGPDPNGSIVAAIDLDGAVLNGRANDEIWQAFSSCNTEVLNDATEVGTNGFQLTTETNNQFGRIWLGDSVDLSQPLRLDFRILLGDKDGSGADGIAFTMHRDSRGYDARGRVGGNLGVGDANSSSGSETKITPAVTIEFDTWRNSDGYDPTYDHTNLFFNGDVKTSALYPGETSNLQTLLPTIEDGLTNSEHGDTLNVSIIVTQTGSDQYLELWVNESMRFDYTG